MSVIPLRSLSAELALSGYGAGALNRRAFLASTAAAVTAAPLAYAANSSAPFVFGYPDKLSYEPGEILALQISTSAAAVDITVERVGMHRRQVYSCAAIPAKSFEILPDASSNGCGWPTALEIPIPAEWPSGYYELTLKTTPGNRNEPVVRAMAYFVVRSSSRGKPAAILLQLSSNTDNAYNNWGGYSLYAFNGKDGVRGRRVSFQRPMPATTVGMWDLSFIAWAEANGYPIDFAVNNDLESHPELLSRYRLVLSVGHDEYWSAGMRDNLEAFIGRGGNAAFFSGNVCCWQVRNENDGLVCYKEDYREDPLYRPDGPNTQLATLWSHYLVARPENQLTGVGVLSGGFHRWPGCFEDGSGAFTVHRPSHWVFQGTNLAQGGEFGGSRTIVGYECDGCEFELNKGVPVPTGRDGTPPGFEILATAPAMWGDESTLTWYERYPKDQRGAACLGLYTKPGGGTVFTAGTTDWSHGLGGEPDPFVDRITRNVLDRLSQPIPSRAKS